MTLLVIPSLPIDELERFLHAYLLDNEPQVHPRSLAVAVSDWWREFLVGEERP